VKGNKERKRGSESETKSNNEERDKGWNIGGTERGVRDKGVEGEKERTRESGRGGDREGVGVRV